MDDILALGSQIIDLIRLMEELAQQELSDIIASKDEDLGRIDKLFDTLCNLADWGRGEELFRQLVDYVRLFNPPEADDLERFYLDLLEEIRQDIETETP